MRYLIGLWMVALTIAAAGDKLDDVRAQLNAGHPDAAIELLRGQLATDPGPLSRILLSQLLLSREGFDEAGEVIDNALVKHPDQPNLQRVLGDLRFRKGRIYDAEKAYKAAIKLDPQNARAIYGISRVFQASCFWRSRGDVAGGPRHRFSRSYHRRHVFRRRPALSGCHRTHGRRTRQPPCGCRRERRFLVLLRAGPLDR